MQGPFTRVVIRRPNGSTEIIGRRGHLDQHKLARDLASYGDVVAVRHEVAAEPGGSLTVAIHPLKT